MKEVKILRNKIDMEEQTAKKAVQNYLIDTLNMKSEDAEDFIELLDKWLTWRELKEDVGS